MLEGVFVQVKLSRWGNSLGLRIPARVAQQLNLEEGEVVKMDVSEETIVISKKKQELSALIALITEQNRHGETDWGPARGREL